jgi:ribosome-binding ATPase YchF (GTP1/OBG family)
VRVCDALIHVVRNFNSPGGVKPSLEEDFRRIEDEMILSDLLVVEKRIERIDADSKKGKKPDEEERDLLLAGKALLEESRPLRSDRRLAAAPQLRGFTLLSAKPQLIVVNNDDEDESTPVWKAPDDLEMLVVRGRLEKEITAIPEEEAEEFRKAYHIEYSVLDLVIACSYRLLNLISFFTVVNEEVRAWTITAGSPALEAAGAVHTDMKRGFIRAEVLSFNELREYGSLQEAKKAGHVRLEGKEYIVQDGDIINFRFNI